MYPSFPTSAGRWATSVCLISLCASWLSRATREVKKSRIIAIVWVILSLGAASFLGLVARGFLNEDLVASGKSEVVFIKTIQQIFSGNVILVFIGGVFLSGILAAIMSTADSQLLVTASAVSEDMYKGVIKKDA